MSKNSIEKAKFRRTPEWKAFRKQMAELYDNKDAITGRPLRKGWNLHHLDLDASHYEILDPDKFIPLNKQTHETLHVLYRQKHCIDEFEKYILLMERFN